MLSNKELIQKVRKVRSDADEGLEAKFQEASDVDKPYVSLMAYNR